MKENEAAITKLIGELSGLYTANKDKYLKVEGRKRELTKSLIANLKHLKEDVKSGWENLSYVKEEKAWKSKGLERERVRFWSNMRELILLSLEAGTELPTSRYCARCKSV